MDETMNVKYRSITEIKPYARNTKKHPTKQLEQIADSIQAFGWAQPIVVDKEGTIIVGHGRFMAAHLLGLTSVPTLELDIDEEKAKAYRLADNKLNESDWDMELVISELKEISLPMVDLTGFDRRLVLGNDDRDDDVPPLPEHPKTKLGDIYELGRHKLVCGDATRQEDYVKLLGTTKVDMFFSDPPYNVNYKGSGLNTSTTILNDKMDNAKFLQFLTDTFKQVKDVIKRGGGLYVFHSSTTQSIFEAAMLANDFQIKAQLIWNKPSAGLGMNDYRTKHEPFFYAGIRDTRPNFYGDRTHTSTVDFQKTDEQLANWAKKQKEAEKEGRTTIWTMKRENVQDYVHPTQKPVELVMYAIHNSSKVDDVVLDPFLGSGSTLIACEKTNRSAYGLELDPRFVDVIVQRYCDFTGVNTVKKNGETITW